MLLLYLVSSSLTCHSTRTFFVSLEALVVQVEFLQLLYMSETVLLLDLRVPLECVPLYIRIAKDH